MSVTLFSIIAIFLYLLAACWMGVRVFSRDAAPSTFKYRLLAVGGVALLLHAFVLHHTIITDQGYDLGFYHAFSLMSWVVVLLVLLTVLIRPTENLAIVFLPFTALALILEQVFSSDHMISDHASIGLRMHVVLSISAYSLLAIAAVQSIILAVQEYQLRHKHPVPSLRLFPPMQTMEEFLIQLLAIGFFLLSLSLATGLMFVHNIMAQHLAHKIVFSILAWLLFGLVLLGRWRRGWRGKTLIRWTLGGFISLMLAYFGSKLVLELILNRVYWTP